MIHGPSLRGGPSFIERLVGGILCAAVVAAALIGGGFAGSARAKDLAPRSLDCSVLPCAEVLPAAVEFRPVDDAKYLEGVSADGEVVGWLALSTDFVDIKGYSGGPLVTLVGLDPQGVITGARVVHHGEPILLVGIPESALHAFVDFYAGKRAVERIVVGRARQPDAVEVDAISGATVTVLAQNHTILEVARRVGAAVGVIDVAALVPGHFVDGGEPWTFRQLLDKRAMARLTVTEREMGVSESDAPFVDLFFAIADAPHVGRGLLGDRNYAHYKGLLEEGEHLVVILGLGSSSFKGSGFVRGGVFDRVRLRQGLREINFRDTDYWNLPDTPLVGAPDFKEGAIFIARGGLLDPGSAYELVFLGSRYDQRGGFSREFREFGSTHELPRSVYRVDASASQAIWRQAWYNRRADTVILLVMLAAVMGAFVAHRKLTADPVRLSRIHTATMLACFLVIGVYMRAQPSVTQILTLVKSTVGEWRWELFLSEPLIFILWIFIAVVSLIWGRGVFCGWVCPYGALTELLAKISGKLGITLRELPDAWHSKLVNLRYVILFVLIAAFLFDAALGERMAEVEPFKSTFLVPAWTRSPAFLAWWVFLLAISFVSYRPFCRYICPLGGALALGSSFRPKGPQRRVYCEGCKICTRGCEPRAIRPDGTINPRECLSCMECEATYRNEKVCPPLIGITRLETRRDEVGLNDSDREKLATLQVKVQDV